MFVKFGNPFELNALNSTYDPDLPKDNQDKSMFKFVWQCRRDCETFPEYDRKTWAVIKPGKACPNYDGYFGCFVGEGSNSSGIFTDWKGGILPLNSSESIENATLVFKVSIQKGDRYLEREISVTLTKGDPPSLEIQCQINCVKKTNIDLKFSLSSKILNRLPYATYIYEWTMVNASNGALINQTVWTKFLARTKVTDPDIAFSANSFVPGLNLKQVYLNVYVSRLTLGVPGTAGIQSYPITFNDCPTVNGNCSVYPPEGTNDNTTFSIVCTPNVFTDPDAPLAYKLSRQFSASDQPLFIKGPYSSISFLNDFTLPLALPSENFTMILNLHAYDEHGASSSIPMTVRVSPVNMDLSQTMAKFAQNIDSISERIRNGEIESATNDLNNMISFLNVIEFSGFDGMVDEFYANNKSITSSAQNETKNYDEQKVKIRENAMMLVSQMPLNSVKFIQTATSIVSTITKMPGEVSSTALELGSRVLNDGVKFLSTSTTISYQEKRETLLALAGGAGNVLMVAAASAKGSLQSSVTDQVSLVDEIGAVLLSTVVPGETPENIDSPNVKLTASKQMMINFDGDISNPRGNMIGISAPKAIFPTNDTGAVLSIMLTEAKNPFFGNSTPPNSVESNTLRLVFRNKDSQILSPANNQSAEPNHIFINTPESLLPVPIQEKAGFDGTLGKIGKIMLVPGMSVSVSLKRVFLPKNITNSSSLPNGNGNQSNLTTSADLTTSDDEDKTVNMSVGWRVYFKVNNRPTVEDFDFLCTIPSDDLKSHIFTRFSNMSDGVLSGVNASEVDRNSCLISDKVLNLNSNASIFYGVEAFFIEKNSSFSVDSSITIHYQMASFSSQCRYWNPIKQDWAFDGCEVGPLTTQRRTHCACTVNSVGSLQRRKKREAEIDETTVPYSVGSDYNPLGGIDFGASLTIPVNTFDPTADWSQLGENPLIFSVMISLVSLYLCSLIWAKRWDMKDEIKAGASPLLDNDPQDSYLYELTVYTGTRRGAGTTAKVSMIFSGFEEETPPRLIYDNKRPVLQTGGIDSFLMAVPRPLGPLNHIRVWHDNSGKSPGWQFAYLCVVDLMTKEKFFFLCNNWLSISEGDGVIDRIIPTATKDDLTDFAHLFWTKTRKDITDGHIWFSVFGRSPKSVFTRCQRLTCCITLLFCTMLSSIFLYRDDDSKGTPDQTFQIGPVSLTLDDIIRGVYSSLMILPMNLLIVQIFRSCKRRESQTLREAKQRNQNYAESLNKIHGAHVTQKKKFKFLLPWWFIFVAYGLCLACVAVSFWATVSIGLQFGAAKCERWMVAFVVSFFESLLLSQPIKVVLFALFFALVIRSPTIEDELDNDPGLLQGEEYLHTHNKNYDAEYIQMQMALSKYKTLPNPPNPEQVAAARRRREKEKEIQVVLREILGYIIFLYIMLSVARGSKDNSFTLYFKHMRNLLQHGHGFMYGPMQSTENFAFSAPVAMNEVSSFDQFWEWCEQTLLPVMFSSVDYSGKPVPRGATMDGVNFLLGSARLRQLRVKKAACPHTVSAVYKIKKICSSDYSFNDEQTNDFAAGWKMLDESTRPAASGFVYNTSEELDTLALKGYHTGVIYSGGGYAYNLGRRQSDAEKAIMYLKENNWVDVYTRAVFLEFTLYNPQMNIYSISFISFELLPTGAMHSNFDVKLIRFERYQGSTGIMTLISEIGMMIYIIYFLVREIMEMREKKSAYFKSFWNCMELLVLTLLLAGVGMLCYRFYNLVATNKKISASKKKDYIGFAYSAIFEEVYLYVIAITCFFAIIKSLKLLRFNKKMNILGHTFLWISRPLMSLMVCMMLVFIAYAHMAFLVYNSLLVDFKTFANALGTLFSLMLNKFDYQGMLTANAAFCFFIFFTFALSMGFVLVNLLISLIIEGFATVRQDLAGKPNQYEVVDFLVSKFKLAVGFGGFEGATVWDKKEAFVEDHEAELDVKFQRFSDRVFSMFLQDPDDLKTMKMAENMLAIEKKRKRHKKIVSM